jgi:hypothetical protein
MKQTLALSLLLCAALAAGCGKKHAQTTPSGAVEQKQDGSSTGGPSYGGATYGAPAGASAAPADPCSAPK